MTTIAQLLQQLKKRKKQKEIAIQDMQETEKAETTSLHVTLLKTLKM